MGGHAKSNFDIITLPEYDHDFESRLIGEEIIESDWVLQRITTSLARQLGGYAIETVRTIDIVENCDDGLSLELTEVDEDGVALGSNRYILQTDGCIKVPGSPRETGYLLAYPEYPDMPLNDIGQNISVLGGIH